jgi:hypothetical protein
MSGQGGYKHRARALGNKRSQRIKQAKENIRRVRNQFEAKGQAWDPENNPAQMAALTHEARRLVQRGSYVEH